MLYVALSPDGRYLCHGNQDATVHVWLTATGKELQMTGYPLKVAQLAATAESGAVVVFEIE
jgi:WD40 repeat protein